MKDGLLILKNNQNNPASSALTKVPESRAQHDRALEPAEYGGPISRRYYLAHGSVEDELQSDRTPLVDSYERTPPHIYTT